MLARYNITKEAFRLIEVKLRDVKSISVLPATDMARDVVDMLRRENMWNPIVRKAREDAKAKFPKFETGWELVEFVCEDVAKQINEIVAVYGI